MNFRQYTEFIQLTQDIFQIGNFFKRKWLITNMLKYTRNTNNSGIRFISRFTMNNIAPKLQKCWTHKISFIYRSYKKILKQQNLFYSQPSTLPKEAFAKFYLSIYNFWFKFYDNFCVPYPMVNFLRIFNYHQNREP